MSSENRISRPSYLSEEASRIRRFTTLSHAEADERLKQSTNNDKALNELYSDPINRAAALTVADAWRRVNDGDQGAMKRARKQLRRKLPRERIEELKPLFDLVKGMYRPYGPGPSRGWARHIRREKSAKRASL